MINFDDVVKEKIKEHNSNLPQIPDHPYRILIIGGSGSRRKNSLFNLINHQSDIDKIYLYAKNPYEAKYQFNKKAIYKFLIKKLEDVRLKHFNDSKAFIKFSKNMVDIYKTQKIIIQIKTVKFIIFDDMIADMFSNEKLNPIVTELLIRGRKVNIYLVFIIQSYFGVPNNIRLNCAHYFIMKIPNK